MSIVNTMLVDACIRYLYVYYIKLPSFDITRSFTTRNVATPQRVTKKALSSPNVATFVGGYIFGVAVPEIVADPDPTQNVGTSPENVAAVECSP